ncbi:hypothetical protein Acor_21950 [Acrocarpospora corrugata]|uniref:DUF4439 domain-containing protein n=1 Tax=Acrocarpospora corrugata TaxID=35763 RepID=A0A5M3VWR4_9ACTN|nr:hypothetical protein [Acrocarpospora corrugata]GES00132.1 hypothetical protein Acor_21950 [Acrocarpospora corrugata]
MKARSGGDRAAEFFPLNSPVISRRALLGASAGLVLVGCAGAPATETAVPEPPDPQLVLLTGVIAAKEQMVSLYQQATLSDAALAGALQPFQQRHLAHLAALRRHLPEDAPSAPPGSPAPVASTAPDVSVAFLREAERKAAAGRPRQLADASPVVSQLLCSIGACEALHVTALGRLR